MIKKNISALLFPVLLVIISTFTYSLAATFSVTKIGALDLGGKTYPEWWYTGTLPTITGTGEANKDVTIKIDTNTSTTKADSSGNWSYYAQLDTGDYSVNISQGSNVYAFKLHLGQPLPSSVGGTSQTSQTTVPVTGSNQIASIAFGLGIALLASYFYITGDVDKRALFEKKMITEE